jgi:hypothetical protein
MNEQNEDRSQNEQNEKPDVEGHRLVNEQNEQNEEPDVEGHQFEQVEQFEQNE